MHGYGALFVMNERYLGEFRDGKFSGNVTRYTADDRIYNQIWQGDDCISETLCAKPEDAWFTREYETESIAAAEYKKCDHCGVAETDRLKHNRCSRCKKVWYCGRECQMQDWKKGHKNVCATPAKT